MESSVNYLYHTLHYILSTYLSYNWKFVAFACQFPTPPHPLPPVATSLISFFMNLFSPGLYSRLSLVTYSRSPALQVILHRLSHQGSPFYTKQCIDVNPNLPVYPNPTFPSWCPYVCSLNLCLYFCFANSFICFLYIFLTYNWLKHYVSSWYSTQWFSISIHLQIITIISLVVICHPTMLSHNYWLYSPHGTFHIHDSFIL